MRDLRQMINTIPWSDLSTAHGSAAHVPDALLSLLSSDEDTRERAYWKLDNYIVLQGTLYPAAFYVVPILVNMLESRVPHGREHIYNLLAEIALGTGIANESITMPNGQTAMLRDACRIAIEDGRSVFQRDVIDPSPSISVRAKELLECLDE